MYGCGADQVLEIEMVLTDGKHVKFGPTDWEEEDGFIYPKTTKVEGKSNNNVDHEESEWEWIECPDSKPFPDVTFEDLWFAVRGGGGGTWGVVLSAYHNLHELLLALGGGAVVHHGHGEGLGNADGVGNLVKKNIKLNKE